MEGDVSPRTHALVRRRSGAKASVQDGFTSPVGPGVIDVGPRRGLDPFGGDLRGRLFGPAASRMTECWHVGLLTCRDRAPTLEL